MLFLKEHLAGNYYWASETSESDYKGNPTRRLFDRFNGNQMLYLINLYGSLAERNSIKEGRRMEALLINHLPLEKKSEISAFNWLREVFNSMPEENIHFIA